MKIHVVVAVDMLLRCGHAGGIHLVQLQMLGEAMGKHLECLGPKKMFRGVDVFRRVSLLTNLMVV